jgi:hypothetical protein
MSTIDGVSEKSSAVLDFCVVYNYRRRGIYLSLVFDISSMAVLNVDE